MSRVLVTGCAGFIGSKVCHVLLEQGRAVVGVDNLNQAYDARLKEWRLSQLRSLPGFDFHQIDIADREGLGRLFAGGAFDAVINLAARAGVRQSLEDPWAYIDANLTGTLNLLELCRVYGAPKLVLASTSSVYGDNAGHFREDSRADWPLSPYAASKKAAETLCYTHHYIYKLDVTVLRYFTVYGPAGRPDMSVFRFIRWIAEGQPLTLYGDGSQARDFTYIDDIAQGTILGLRPVGYEVINLGSDRPARIIDVIALLEEKLGKKADIRMAPANPLDVKSTWADVTKAKAMLGWAPQTTLEEGLGRAADWYMDNRLWARELSL